MDVYLENLRFAWTPGGKDVLNIPKFSLAPGAKVFLAGASGSGKTTLLNLIAGVLLPTSGQLWVLGNNSKQLSARDRDRLRGEQMGFVFQQFNLVPFLSIKDNLRLRSHFAPGLPKASLEEISHLLSRLGLGDKSFLKRKASELSVGQMQRVALARALMGKPKLLIADEPTSALDEATREPFLDLLLENAQASKMSVLFVSHDTRLKTHFDQTFAMEEINHV